MLKSFKTRFFTDQKRFSPFFEDIPFSNLIPVPEQKKRKQDAEHTLANFGLEQIEPDTFTLEVFAAYIRGEINIEELGNASKGIVPKAMQL